MGRYKETDLLAFAKNLGISSTGWHFLTLYDDKDSSIEAACVEIGAILKELEDADGERDPYLPLGNPDSAAAILSAKDLILKLHERGHESLLCPWAILRLIARNLLGAEIAQIFYPAEVQSSEDTTGRPSISRVALEACNEIIPDPYWRLRIPVSNEPGPIYLVRDTRQLKLATRQQGVDYVEWSYLVVWPTPSLWRWCRTKTIEPRAVAQSRRVKLFRRQDRPMIGGKKKPVLSPNNYDLVKTLIEAGHAGCTKSDLERVSTDYWHSLKRLTKTDQDWREVIIFPGRPHGRYRIQ